MDYIGQPSEVSKAVGVSAHRLREMARTGKLRHAERIGGRWYINATREWPALKLERKVK